MKSSPLPGLLEVLQQIPDSGGRSGRRHSLSTIMAAMVCATLCGHQGIRATVRWLELHGIKMAHLLGFTRKPPCRKTYSDILAIIDCTALEKVLVAFVNQMDLPECKQTNPVEEDPIEVWDGKTLRGTRAQETRAEQVLVRMGIALQRMISCVAVPSGTNEQSAGLELVKSLVLEGK